MRTWLVILIAVSLFVGVPLQDKGWYFLVVFEFVELPGMLWNRFDHYQIWLYIVTIVAHFQVFLLPFIMRKRLFRLLLVIAPLAYIVSFFLLAGPITSLTIPFTLVWIAVLIKEFTLKNKPQP